MKTADLTPVRSTRAAEPRSAEGARTWPRRSTLRANFLWTFLGNLVYTGCQWGMLVVLAKIGNVEMVGQFALGLALAAPVLMFTNLQLRSVQATDARHEFAFGDYLALRLAMTALALLVIAALAVASGQDQQTTWVIGVVGAAKACEAVSDVFYGLLQQHERLDRIALSLLIKGPLSLAVLGAGVYLTGSLLGGVIGLAASWALVLVAYDIPSALRVQSQASGASPTARASRLRPRWDLGTLGKLIRLALPLGVVMCIISLNTNIPRYFVESHLGLRELGIFSAICYLLVAGSRVVSALGESASPRLARYYAAGELGAFRRLLLRLVALAAVLGGLAVVVVLLAGSELLALVYRPEYGDYAGVFLWLMVAAALGYMGSFLGYGMTAARFFRVQAPLFVAVGVVTGIACALLVPDHDLLGAAWAMGIAGLLQLLGSAAVIAYALRSPAARSQP